MPYIFVGIGSAIGGIARFWLSGLVANKFGQTFPWGTLIINVTGSFAIAFFGTLTDPQGRYLVSPNLRTFFMIGICGGYTTFSSFSLQTLSLAQDGEWLYAGANCASSLIFCLAGAWLGHFCAMLFNPK
jgi:fluoride exporter